MLPFLTLAGMGDPIIIPPPHVERREQDLPGLVDRFEE